MGDGEDADPETEVPVEEGEGGGDDSPEPTPKGGKKKRTWQKVNSLYNPAPYAAQKGAGKSSKGGGKGKDGGCDGGYKGKGRGKEPYGGYGDGEGKSQHDDGGKPGRDKGKGKGGPPGAAQRKGGPGGPGPVPGPGAMPGGPGMVPPGGQGPGPGGMAAKGAPVPPGGAMGAKGGPASGDGAEPGADGPEDAPRPPGPQRHPLAGKGLAGGVPVAMAPYGFGSAISYPAVSYPYGPVPAAMYAMPYYVMPSPTPLNTGSSPYMPGGPQSPTTSSGDDRSKLKTQVQQQIEYYFGRDNMIRDVYLKSRLMNEEGWVQIATLANFRKVQSMTMDMTVILDAITSSQKLEMDPQGQHVRLKDGWQEWVFSKEQGSSPTNAEEGGGGAARGA